MVGWLIGHFVLPQDIVGDKNYPQDMFEYFLDHSNILIIHTDICM